MFLVSDKVLDTWFDWKVSDKVLDTWFDWKVSVYNV